MKKNLTLTVLALGALTIMLSAAGPARAQAKAEAGAAPMREIVFAADATWPPMEFIDKNKQLVGYSVDYMRLAGELAGFKAVTKNVAWDGIFAGLGGGQYDAIASSITITEERKKNLAFSEPYCTVRQAIVVPKDSPIKTLADLKGKTVGSQISTTGTFAIKTVEGAISKTYDEVGLAIEDLFNGRLEAVVCDYPVAADFVLKKDRYKTALKIGGLAENIKEEHYGVAVKPGDTETLALINKGIRLVKEQGKDKELIKKWMGE